MRRINLLHTIETSGPGGAENVLLSLVKGLDPERFRSTVVLNRGGWLEERLRECGADVLRVEWNRWWDLKLPRAMARIIREREIDLIHSHLPDQNFYSCIAGRLTGRPVLVTYHGPVELQDADGLRGSLKLRTVRSTAARVIVVCDFVRHMLRDIGFPDTKLCRIYNGIRTERFQQAERGTVRRALQLTDETPLVGTVGNIRGPKGQKYFIQAARRVAETIPEAHFVISGDLHPTLAPPLLRLTEEMGLQDRLHFLGFRADVPQVIADLDVFVLPSTSEGFPLVVLEAMASARAVVATRCGGAEEMLPSEELGRLIPVADEQAMAASILELLRDPGLRTNMGRAARQHCERNFSIASMISAYEQLYCESVAMPAADAGLVQSTLEGGGGCV
ncbi:MAG: glycosyltransferase [Acidobacteriota bacterium]|nr:glycosyltransferase [Acidobacteriota bacterium]